MSDERTRVYYEADCGFCRWSMAWLLRWDRRRRLRAVPIQGAEGERDLGDLGPERFDSWHVVRDGERHSGGRAFAPLLEELPGGRWLAPIARRLEFALVPLYRWVAEHRSRFSRRVPGGARRRADELLRLRR